MASDEERRETNGTCETAEGVECNGIGPCASIDGAGNAEVVSDHDRTVEVDLVDENGKENGFLERGGVILGIVGEGDGDGVVGEVVVGSVDSYGELSVEIGREDGDRVVCSGSTVEIACGVSEDVVVEENGMGEEVGEEIESQVGRSRESSMEECKHQENGKVELARDIEIEIERTELAEHVEKNGGMCMKRIEDGVSFEDGGDEVGEDVRIDDRVHKRGGGNSECKSFKPSIDEEVLRDIEDLSQKGDDGLPGEVAEMNSDFAVGSGDTDDSVDECRNLRAHSLLSLEFLVEEEVVNDVEDPSQNGNGNFPIGDAEMNSDFAVGSGDTDDSVEECQSSETLVEEEVVRDIEDPSWNENDSFPGEGAEMNSDFAVGSGDSDDLVEEYRSLDPLVKEEVVHDMEDHYRNGNEGLPREGAEMNSDCAAGSVDSDDSVKECSSSETLVEEEVVHDIVDLSQNGNVSLHGEGAEKNSVFAVACVGSDADERDKSRDSFQGSSLVRGLMFVDKESDVAVCTENDVSEGSINNRKSENPCLTDSSVARISDDLVPEDRMGSTSVECRGNGWCDLKFGSFEGMMLQSRDGNVKDESSLSVETSSSNDVGIDESSIADTAQKVEDGDSMDEPLAERAVKPTSDCPTEQGVYDSLTFVIPTEQEHVHDGTAPQDCEEFPDAKGGDRDVRNGIDVDEETSISSNSQVKSASEDDGEKPVNGGLDAVGTMHQNGIVPMAASQENIESGNDLTFYMVRIPRIQDEELAAKIRHAEASLEERTKMRDVITGKIQDKMASFEEYRKNINDARNDERTAREAFYTKQHEVDAIHSTADIIEIRNSIDRVDERIQNLCHRMQHETISLKEEKQLMKEIKELKQKRGYLSKLTPQTEIQKAFEQKDHIEENLMRLRPELENLRRELSQAEAKLKAARKKYDDECEFIEDLRGQRKAADDRRQEAYTDMKNFKKQLYEKNKHFYQYKDDMRTAVIYSSSDDKAALGNHCNDQIDRFMGLWNKNDDFRSQYIKANQYSTIRRFRTLDGRSLGLDEHPAVLPHTTGRKLENGIDTLSSVHSMQPTNGVTNKAGKPSEPNKVTETSSHVANGNKVSRPKKLPFTDPQPIPTTFPNEEAEAEDKKRERQMVEDAEKKRLFDEQARKDEVRKEQAAEELKEKIRLEQISKAREAEERKKRRAEKAKVAAEIRAKKEAELKEKKRAKKERQKEKRASTADRSSSEVESAPDAPSEEAIKLPEINSAPTSRKNSRIVQMVKPQYKKIEPRPAPLRNKNKRKMPTWLWALLIISIISILFLAANYMSSSRRIPQHSGF